MDMMRSQTRHTVTPMKTISSWMSGRPALRRVVLAALAGVAIGGLAIHPAKAWWRGGVWIGGPVFVGPPVVYPPVVYPPPVYYPPPPPVWYTPPQAQAAPPATPTGQSCYAGPYVCPMDRPVASGSACYCLSNERSKIWGRAS